MLSNAHNVDNFDLKQAEILLRTSLILVGLILSGCIKNSSESARTFRIPWSDAQNRYTLQDIEIKTFDEPQFLRGSLAEFFIEPTLIINEGKLAQAGVPTGRFLSTPSGSQVALDDASLQAATLYAHLEKLNELDVSSGAASFLNKRPAVAIKVGFVDENNRVMENNAQYNPLVDAILFVPYTDSKLPITLNGGVVAHEHFHSIFHHIVLSHFDSTMTYAGLDLDESHQVLPKAPHEISNKDVSIKTYNLYLLRGINEGLADFWGWIYSGDELFVGRSISSALDVRRLDRKDPQFFDLATFKFVIAESDNSEQRVAHAYSLGTQYAIYFRNIFLQLYEKKTDPETRAKVAKTLVKALFKFRTELALRLEKEYLPPEIFIASFYKALQEESSGVQTFNVCESYQRVAPLAHDKIAGCEPVQPVVETTTPPAVEAKTPPAVETPAPPPPAKGILDEK